MYDRHHPTVPTDSMILSRQAADRHAVLSAIREGRPGRPSGTPPTLLMQRRRIRLDGWIRRLGLG